MIHTIRLYIEKYRLLSEDRPVLVGLSGGADSVALLGVLVPLLRTYSPIRFMK